MLLNIVVYLLLNIVVIIVLLLKVLVACRLAAGLAAFTAIVGGAVYSQTSGHNFNLSKIAEGFGNSVAALLSPENNNAGIYSFLTAGLGLYSLVLLFGSHEASCYTFLHSLC